MNTTTFDTLESFTHFIALLVQHGIQYTADGERLTVQTTGGF